MDDIYKKFRSLSENVKSIDKVTPDDESVDVSYTIQSPGSAEYEKDMTWTSTDTKFTIPGATESTAGVLSSQDKIYINSIVEGDKPLASISISGNWTITPTTTLYSNLTSNSMTIDYGYTASWVGTWKWSASSSQKVPESCSGAWGITLTSNNIASSSLTKSNITSAQSWNQSIYAKKRGLVVSNNKVTLMTSDNATNDSASASVSINFTYCKFVGYCTNVQPTSSDILNSFKQIARGTNNQLTTQNLSPGETEYVFYAYPSNFSDIKSAKLGGVEEIIDAWTKKTNVTVTMPVSGTSIVYKVYVSTKTGAYKSQTVTFS